MAELAAYKSEIKPDWCPGCGDYGVLSSLQKACADLDIPNHNLMCVSGIGCSSNFPGFFNSYGLHTLHGRGLAVAQGVKLANPDLTVVGMGGDGDGYGIGCGHFMHALRRNINMTYFVMNNQIYGLTTGQTSPTTDLDVKTKSTPHGNQEYPFNPVAIAIAGGCTFVARGFSGEPMHLAELFKQAIQHQGFSLIDCFSPCVTYNKINTFPWFKQMIYKIEETGHDPKNFDAAMKLALQKDKLPIGVLYKNPRTTYDAAEPALVDFGAPVKQDLTWKDPEILLEFL